MSTVGRSRFWGTRAQTGNKQSITGGLMQSIASCIGNCTRYHYWCKFCDKLGITGS